MIKNASAVQDFLGWLGAYKAQVESVAYRRVESLRRGGDRKSKRVKNQGVGSLDPTP